MVRELRSRSPEETARIGEQIGRSVRAGEVIGIVGELGAGKTCFVRGLARGLALDPDVVYSPSFTLVAEHHGQLTLHHIDLFRLGEPVTMEEADEIGLREYLDPSGVTVIEWASRLENGREESTLWVEIDLLEDGSRNLRLSASAKRGEELLAALGSE